jgi:hypothetical protein
MTNNLRPKPVLRSAQSVRFSEAMEYGRVLRTGVVLAKMRNAVSLQYVAAEATYANQT